jgi:hypothetical protein
LVRNFSRNQTSISYISSSITLNFNQTANVNLKLRKQCVFCISSSSSSQPVTVHCWTMGLLYIRGFAIISTLGRRVGDRSTKSYFTTERCCPFPVQSSPFVASYDTLWKRRGGDNYILLCRHHTANAYFAYTTCYFKVVTFFKRNLLRVTLPYLLLIRSIKLRNLTRKTVIADK